MDSCGLIPFIYFCSGRGQPDGADKRMRLDGQCCPDSVTDLCPSVPVSQQSNLFNYVSLSLHVGGVCSVSLVGNG